VELGEPCEIAAELFPLGAAGSDDGAGEGACSPEGGTLFSVGEGGSSSSESESSLSELAPADDALLRGESGLSGPSSSSSSSSFSPPSGSSSSGSSASGCSEGAGAGTLVALVACRRTRLGTTTTGDGRLS
jgi:hypothetical protein